MHTWKKIQYGCIKLTSLLTVQVKKSGNERREVNKRGERVEVQPQTAVEEKKQ